MYHCYLNYASENTIFHYTCKMTFEILEITEHEHSLRLGLNVNLKCCYCKRYTCSCEAKCRSELSADQ